MGQVFRNRRADQARSHFCAGDGRKRAPLRVKFLAADLRCGNGRIIVETQCDPVVDVVFFVHAHRHKRRGDAVHR